MDGLGAIADIGPQRLARWQVQYQRVAGPHIDREPIRRGTFAVASTGLCLAGEQAESVPGGQVQGARALLFFQEGRDQQAVPQQEFIFGGEAVGIFGPEEGQRPHQGTLSAAQHRASL